MKRFYTISWGIDGSVAHFIRSAIISFLVMEFINTFIGGIGGVAALSGFFVAFYLLRSLIMNEKRISHQFAMDSKTELKYFLKEYIIMFSSVWLIMRVVLFVSKISGWGNVNNLGVVEYIQKLYGTTMLEKWAYIFTGLFMATYIVSLFPLIVIRKWNKWIIYFVVDCMFFALLSYVITGTALRMVDAEVRDRVGCVLDVMLLCKLPQKWEAGIGILIMAVLCFNVGLLSFNYSVYIFGPKMGRFISTSKDIEGFVKKDKESADIKKKVKLVGTISAGILICGIVLVYDYFFEAEDSDIGYKKVAEYMTGDSVLGPMNYNDTIYIPLYKELDYDENGMALGYLGHKNQSCDSRFYRLAINNVLYAEKNGKIDFLKMSGSESNTFTILSELENEDKWMKDDVFILWDEEWTSESVYSKERTGYTECNKNLIVALENTFGKVKYKIKDFQDYDSYFTIRSYDSLKDVADLDVPYGNWVGCILVKDNQFYYGNYNNKITGVMLHQLLQVLGGN